MARNSRVFEGRVTYDDNVNEEQFRLMESNLRLDRVTAIIYDGMYGVGDSDVSDCIPSWLGFSYTKFEGKDGELYDMEGFSEPIENTCVDMMDIVNAIHFFCDEDGDITDISIEFDKESLILALGNAGLYVNEEGKFDDLKVIYHGIHNLTKGMSNDKRDYTYGGW